MKGYFLTRCRRLLVFTIASGFFLFAPLLPAADLVWTNTAGGIWSDAINWSPNSVPGSGDSATLAIGANVTVPSLTTISNFTFSNGTLKGNGLLQITNQMDWSNGDLCSAVTIATNATLNISGGVSFGLNNGAKNGGGALTNFGTVNFSGGTHYGYGNALIYNAGLWTFAANNTLNTQFGTNWFFNVGTIAKTSTGTQTMDWQFNTTGTINALSGKLSFSQWMGNNILHGAANLDFTTMKASLVVASNAVMNWGGGDLCGPLTVENGGALTISNSVMFGYDSGTRNGGGALTNFGTVNFSGNTHYGYGNAVIYNAGLWEFGANSGLNAQFGTNRFFNFGTIAKTSTGTQTMGWQFNTTGTINSTNGGTLSIGSWIGESVFHGSATFALGDMLGSLSLAPDSSLTWKDGTVTGALNVSSNAVMNWAGGDLSGALTVESGGLLTISNSVSFGLNNGAKNGGGALTNFGTVNFSGGTHYGYGNALIYNAGLWTFAANNTLNTQFGTNWFFNVGTIAKTSTGTQTMDWQFNTTGTINALSGKLSFSQWMGNNILHGAANLDFTTMKASLVIASNAVMNWMGGDLDGAFTVQKGGLLTISNSVSFGYNSGARNGGGALTNFGTVNFSGNTHYGYGNAMIYNAGLWLLTANNNLNSQFGTNQFFNVGTLQKTGTTGTSTLGWQFNCNGEIQTPGSVLALVDWNGGSTISGLANLNLGTMSQSLTVASNAIVNWRDGDLTGALTVSPGGTLSVSNSVSFGYGNGARNAGGALTNLGTVIWAGSTHYGYGNALIYNAGLWEAVTDNNLLTQYGTNQFFNVGTLTKNAGSGATTIGWDFNCNGVMQTPLGKFALGKWFGTNTFQGNATLNLGTMLGSLTVVSNAFLNWMAGDLCGPMTIAPGGILTVSNSVSFGYNNGIRNTPSVLTNNGSVFWAGSTHYGYGNAMIYNASLWQITANNSLLPQYGTNLFVNAGTLEKISPGSAATINWPFQNSGTVDSRSGSLAMQNGFHQTAGQTLLHGGNLSVASGLLLDGGLLAGSNTISGNVTNNALIEPGGEDAGKLTISGNYFQTSSGRLDLQLGGTNVGSNYDQLAVNGAATLGGELNVTLLDPFLPAAGNSFRVVTFYSFVGDFNEVNGLVLSTNLALQANYSSTALDLAAAVTNQPALLPKILSQPQSLTIINGQTADFHVTATGTRPFFYQWQFNETNLFGENGTSLTFANAQTNRSGNYRVVITNDAGAVTSSVAVLTVRPVADLVIANLSNPTNAIAGQPVALSWQTLNQGNQSALAPWTESVGLSPNASGSPEVFRATFSMTNSLASGESATRMKNIIPPGGLDGNYFVVIRADYYNQVAEEENEANNTTVSTEPITIHSPDLLPVSISSETAAQLGQAISIGWNVTNAGAAPALSAWTDRIYLSAVSNQIYGATLLAQFAVTNFPVSAGSVLTNQTNVVLPFSQNLLPGIYFLVVAVDSGNSIAETNENNNLFSAPIALSLPPLPDLEATNIIAPANALPGQTVSLSWSVTNRGNLSATNAWSETIYLATSENGSGGIELATVPFTNNLAVGSSLTRTQQVILPVASPLGNAWFAVKIDSRNDVFESNETNNFLVATNATAIPAVLSLQLSVSEIREGNALPIHAIVTRNGSTASALTVTITNSDVTELAAPTNIILNAGQASVAFDIFALADGIVDGAQSATIGVSAPGFDAASKLVTVLDADLPSLALTLSTNIFDEGTNYVATVSRNAGTNLPVVVNLRSSNPARLLPPVSVTMNAGDVSTNFSVVAVDNLTLENPASYLLSATATNYNGASNSVTIFDNDLPQVILSLSSLTVSENSGPQAILATVQRTPVTTTPIYLEIANDNTAAALAPSLVTIPASAASASFPIAVLDNSLIDGNKNVPLHVWAKTSAAGSRISEVAQVTFTVTDDDGPALQLNFAKTLLPEGANPATTATVSRNTGTNGSLSVNLVSSDTGELTVPVSVVIPAGATSVTFNVATPSDGVSDGSKSVGVTASAAGFESAVAHVTVSDIDQPDLVISAVTAPASGDTETFANLGYQIRNQGFGGTISNTIVQRIYLSSDPVIGGDTLVGEYNFNGGIPAGAQFGQSFAVRLPQTAGDYWVVVETDVNNAIPEILENNNVRISAAPIHVNAAYAATVSTTFESGAANSLIPLTGCAYKTNNVRVPFALVNIHINVRGTHRVISALTDSAGNFSTTWRPLPGEAGFYEIGAAHPGFTNAPTQDSFSIFGINASPSSISLTVPAQGSVTGAVEIANAGDLALSGLSAEIVQPSGNVNATVSLSTSSLDGLATGELNYSIATTAAGQGGFVARLTSAEGATLDILFNVEVQSLEPRLVPNPSPLVRGIKRGAQIFTSINVTNLGSAASGPVTISLPQLSWMKLISPNPLPSIAPGENAEINLQLLPPPDLDLATYSGNVLLGAAGNVVAVPFEFRALSESKGDLFVSASDEFTYFASGAPKVTNATVEVRDAMTGSVVTNGMTGTNGNWFAAQLPEGYYEIEVNADKHSSSKGTYLLLAGITNDISAFLQRQTVTYTWTVVPTEIEDHYRIVVDTEFEANIPAPVVTITPSVIDLADLTNGEMQVDLVIENHGLIAAEDFELQFDEHPDVTFEPLISKLGTLPAKSTFTVPLIIRRVAASALKSNGQIAAADSLFSRIGSCLATARGVDHYTCGPFPNIQVTRISFPNAGDCIPAIPIPSLGWTGGGTGGGIRYINCLDCGGPPSPHYNFGSYSGGGGFGHNLFDLLYAAIYKATPVLAIPNPCDPDCAKNLIPALLACKGLSPPSDEPSDCEKSKAECAHSLFQNPLEETAVNCLASGITCVRDYGLKRFPVLDCIYGILSACAPPEEDRPARSYANAQADEAQGDSAFSGPYAGLLGTLQTRVDRIEAVQDSYVYTYGDGVWSASEDQAAVKAFFGQFLTTINSGSDEGTTVSITELNGLLNQPLPAGVEASHINHLVERWNRSVAYWHAGIFNLTQVPVGQSTDFIALDRLDHVSQVASNALAQSEMEGFTSLEAGVNGALADMTEALSAEQGGTCAKVKLRLTQDAVLSRDAFNATLEIANREGSPLENISVTIGALDVNGQDASALFGFHSPELTGITGTNGNGILSGNQTGKLSWSIVPTVDAAPTNATKYFILGQLNYVINGETISVPLAPAEITVYPTPRLTVDYFHQRDVFSDDPYTDVVEPAIPFSLAVMVQNKGFGTAKNFRITSAQPEIVENEKGLLIDFKILATEVAGKNLKPDLTADMGDIASRTNAIARWLLTSTLQGLFIDYKASFEHLDDLGNEKLSIIDQVNIHEMTHVVQAGGAFEDTRPDFLVNEIPDVHDFPDTIYFSDGSTNPVQVVTNAIVTGTLSPGNLQVQLTAALPGGWSYLNVPDPADGQYHLVQIIRSDDVSISVETNAWITDRTFLGLGKKPVRENVLHLLDYNSTGNYTLIYELNPALDVTPPTSFVTSLPVESSVGIPLHWSGQDNLGISSYDIFVSDNSGPYFAWLANTISTSGIYQGVFNHSYSFYSVATDAAGNREDAPASPDAQTTVTRTNHAPVFEIVGTRTITEGETLSVNLVATDADNDGLTFSIGAGSPPGVSVNAQNGLLTWPTGEAQGPSTNSITVVVRDSGIPQLSATQTFSGIVLEDNLAPTLSPIPNFTIAEGELLSVTNVASDGDLPPQQLTFSLGSGVPFGVAINAGSGIFTWRPTETQGGTTNAISVIVRDNAAISLSATQTFSVVVIDSRPDFLFNVGTTQLLSGASASIPLRLSSGADLTNINVTLNVGGNRLTNLNLTALTPELSSAQIQSVGTNRYQLHFSSLPDARLQGDLLIAQLAFDTIPVSNSIVAHLRSEIVSGQRASTNVTLNGSGGEGRVFVIGAEPILDVTGVTNGTLATTLYGLANKRYAIESVFDLGGTNVPAVVDFVTSVSLKTEVPLLPMEHATEFFRARRLPDSDLSLRIEAGQLIIEWPLECADCVLQEADHLGENAVWNSSATSRETLPDRYRVTISIGSNRRFYRLSIP